jgi:hypothetical protein
MGQSSDREKKVPQSSELVTTSSPTGQVGIGLREVSEALEPTAKKSTFALGFALTAAATAFIVFGPTIPATLMAAGAFQIFGRLGCLLDRRFGA